MALIEAEIAALEGDRVQLGVFFHLATDAPLRCWMGIGEIRPGVNAIDPENEVYLGVGRLTQVPEFQAVINGQADRVECALSGVSSETLALLMDRADGVRHRLCAFGYALMDRNWTLIGPVHWTRRGVADVVRISQQPQNDASNPILRSVVLSVGSFMTGRRRRLLSYYTHADHQRRSPTDLFCERVATYQQEVSKVWPRF